MRVVLATDHAGFELKEHIRSFLDEQGVDVEDFGAHEYDPDDDFPQFIAAAAHAVSSDPENVRGIIIGGSGQGEAIVANRFPHVRAIVYYGDPEQKKSIPLLSLFGDAPQQNPFDIIRLSREHNDANILSLGARFLTTEDALEAVSEWLLTSYSEEERHERRIGQIEDLFSDNTNNEEEL